MILRTDLVAYCIPDNSKQISQLPSKTTRKVSQEKTFDAAVHDMLLLQSDISLAVPL